MEGPSIHLLQEELHDFIGQSIKDVSGNARFDKAPLVKQTIKDIYAFGKRLIIQLDTRALVIHFLMYGSYRVDEPRSGMAPRLALITTKHALYLYNCSVKCLEAANLKDTLPLEQDILSAEWNSAHTIKAIKQHPQQTIDDVLLDQDIFAGVGNIIKNEVLFMSGVSPQTKVVDLSAKKIKEITLNARAFSQRFLELRKIFQLKKNLQIYRKKVCPVCGFAIIRQKTGARKRWSFFCSHCQH